MPQTTRPIQEQFGERVIETFADFARADLKSRRTLEAAKSTIHGDQEVEGHTPMSGPAPILASQDKGPNKPTPLDPIHQGVLRMVCDYFIAHDRWPGVRSLELDVEREFGTSKGIEMICQEIGADRVHCGSLERPMDTCVLTLSGIDACISPSAEREIERVLAAARYCAKRYRDARGAECSLPASDFVADLQITDREARRTGYLIINDGSLINGSSSGDETVAPSFTLSPFAGKVLNVQTLDDFMRRRDEYSAERRRIAEARQPRRVSRVPAKVFLSHAAADHRLAALIGDALKSAAPGLQLFVASKPGEIPTGEEWLREIKSRLRASDTYIVLLTPISVERPWIWFETGAAWMGDRKLIPVVGGGLSKAAVPYPLGAHQALSLDSFGDVEQLFRDCGGPDGDAASLCAAVKELGNSADQ